MDQYYFNNREYPVFLESLKPLIEQETENKDYEVVGLIFNLGNGIMWLNYLSSRRYVKMINKDDIEATDS